MKKKGICLFFLCAAVTASAEMVVYTTDGRMFPIPINAGDIAKIEYSNTGTKPPTLSKPAKVDESNIEKFLGLWHRSEGGKIVEYMEIRVNKGEIEAVFGDRLSGPFATRVVCLAKNNGLFSNGEKRALSMKLEGNNQISYTSTDQSGGNAWNCTWKRAK